METAELAAHEMSAEATDAKEVAMAHFQSGAVFISEGLQRHKDECFARAHDEEPGRWPHIQTFPMQSCWMAVRVRS